MLEEAKQRTFVFQEKLRQAGIELAILTDESSIAYLAGFLGLLPTNLYFSRHISTLRGHDFVSSIYF